MNKNKKDTLIKYVHFTIFNISLFLMAASFSFYLWLPKPMASLKKKEGDVNVVAKNEVKKSPIEAKQYTKTKKKREESYIYRYHNILRIKKLIQSELRMNDNLSEEIAYSIQRYTSDADIPPELVIAVMKIESHGRPKVVSNKGARGLLQIMPFWKKVMEMEEADLFDPDTNIRMGVEILKRYIKRYKTLEKALAAYNGSKGSRKYPNKVFKVYDKIVKNKIPKNLYKTVQSEYEL